MKNQMYFFYLYTISLQDSPFGTVRYSLVGDDSAQTYFSINEVTGLIQVERSLQAETTDKFRVCTLVV